MTDDHRWPQLATGDSGFIELEREWLLIAREVFELFCVKQRSYGPGNITRMGAPGVATRLIDKVERLENAYHKGGLKSITKTCPHCGEAIKDENLIDVWLDTADYGIIGLLCLRGLWPGLEKE